MLSSSTAAAAAPALSAPVTLFLDLDDTLYQNGWKTAALLTAKIEKYCEDKLGLTHGQAFELYKQHGTCLRGLQQEGIPHDTDEFLSHCHDVPHEGLIERDAALRATLQALGPHVEPWVFTASTDEHARRCLGRLGVDDLLLGAGKSVIDVRACGWLTKHDLGSFAAAQRIAAHTGDPSRCILVDDSWRNMEAARAAGWTTVLCGRTSRYGQPATECAHADHVVGAVTELPDVLPHLFGDLPPPPPPLQIEAGGAAAMAGAKQLQVGGAVQRLDELGPIVVNTDGTMSRISSWHSMSEPEQATTKRVITKRNAKRLKALKEAADGALGEARPDDESKYRSAKYWDDRYKADDATFEWFADYAKFSGFLRENVPAAGRVLHPGAGTSALSREMADDGYGDVTFVNTDVSPVAVELMRGREPAGAAAHEWAVDDALHSQYADGSFDAIVDKGLLDGLMCGNDGPNAARGLKDEYLRLLKPGGVLAVLSMGDPDSRLPHLAATEAVWEHPVAVHEVPADEAGAASHWAYALTRARD